MATELTVSLGVAIVLLVALAVGVTWWGQLGVTREIALAAVRAVVQLAAVSALIAAVLRAVGWSLLFVAAMAAVAVWTSAQRIGAVNAWPWVGATILLGVLPTLVILFGTGAVPWSTPSLVSVSGIVIGGAMTASSLNGRRCFAALREEHNVYEAGLSLGLIRADAVTEIIGPRLAEALVPGLDQTRTVGLVTLPGAYVGVLLGGGSPLQAGAAQIVVLCGLLATQSLVVVAGHQLIRAGRLLPADLAAALRP